MPHCPIVEPPWTVDLPRLDRDGPADREAPAFRRPNHHVRLPSIAASYTGQTGGDEVRAWALALRHRCSLRVCGCYYFDEDTDIACVLVSLA
jgi:hypothetical protein